MASSAFASSSNYTLYFAPGAASLAPKMLLKSMNKKIDFAQVDLKSHTLSKDNSDYYKINKTGMVPALKLQNGKILTETAVILQYFADQDSSHKFLPSVNKEERYFVLEKLNFVATEIHKSIEGWFRTSDKEFFIAKMSKNLAILDSALEGKSFIANDKLSIADFYLTTALFEIKHFAINDLTNFKNLEKYLDKMMNDKNVKEVLKSEGFAK